MLIGNLNIGDQYPPQIIVEIGINHNGNIKTALKMVDSAFNAGAKIIKHQTHIIESEYSKYAKKIVPGNSNKSIYEIMNKCSLNEQDEKILKDYVEFKKMIFISSAFSFAAVERLEKFNVVAYKIGSGEMNNLPLIEEVAKLKKPMIISTGMNKIKSINETIKIVKKYRNSFALLHCTNVYPTPFNIVRLNSITEMKKKFQNIPIGYSDHTINNDCCIAAIGLGANLIEKHFTDKKSRKGPDIVCSMDEKDLKSLLSSCKNIFEARIGKKDDVIKEENVTKRFAFASVIVTKNLKKGSLLNEKNLSVKRPGTGPISAKLYSKYLGKKINRKISKDSYLKHTDILK